MVIVERIPKGVLDHGIHQSSVVHPVSITSLRNGVGSHGHILHAACHNDVRIAGHDHLSGLVHAVKAGTAYHIHGHRRHLDGQPCFDGSLAGHVLPLACLDYAAHIYLVNLLGSHAGPA